MKSSLINVIKFLSLNKTQNKLTSPDHKTHHTTALLDPILLHTASHQDLGLGRPDNVGMGHMLFLHKAGRGFQVQRSAHAALAARNFRPSLRRLLGPVLLGPGYVQGPERVGQSKVGRADGDGGVDVVLDIRGAPARVVA